jgi:hypothetical protein
MYAAARVLAFITDHQGCEGGVVAADDSQDWKHEDPSKWPEDHGEPTVRAAREALNRPATPPPSLEERVQAMGLPVPTRGEKVAIFAETRKAQADAYRVTEGFERTADLLEPLRDPTLEPLQRPQEP